MLVPVLIQYGLIWRCGCFDNLLTWPVCSLDADMLLAGMFGLLFARFASSHCWDGFWRYAILTGVDSKLQPHQPVGNLESNVPPASYADSLKYGLGIPPPAADEFPKVDSVEQPSDASPFKPLDKAHLLKVVRFAPEILSVEAPNCAPHRRKLVPCSDICHPIKFRRSNLGDLDSEDAPVDDSPKLASSPFAPPREALGEAPIDDVLSSIDILQKPSADIKNHDLMVPLSDGKISEMVPASAIDPDHTPGSITHLSSKYSLEVGDELF
ncbi:hypothetical protein Nepgr_018775 [Nepenthes gracilis]|uniref:Uncharacterized protein n=1 Tax=Nepenthes gracilis TaxID=150966 RepID=A0AAD3XUC6_NEPGR|nr:hypothetical protein Nepgr_018775 [Nepenthes gracilis]